MTLTLSPLIYAEASVLADKAGISLSLWIESAAVRALRAAGIELPALP